MPDQALSSVKGIGPKRVELLARLGLFSLLDLLRFTPRAYHDFSCVKTISDAPHGEFSAVRVISVESVKTFRRADGLLITTAVLADETAKLQAIWFNQPYAIKNIKDCIGGYALGQIDRRNGVRMLNAVFSSNLPGIIPVYPLVKGLTQGVMRRIMRTALEHTEEVVEETLPSEVLNRFNLTGIVCAVKNIHFPQNTDALKASKRRLAFDDALAFSVIIEKLRYDRNSSLGIEYDVAGCMESFVPKLRFTPTKAQSRVMEQIESDMAKSRPMNRLLQGDVGSGKTVPALYAMYIAAQNGYQSVLMAPTEILAEQHYEQARSIFGENCALLTGSMGTTERKNTIEKIINGRVNAIVGTHAIISESVRFAKLGIVIADEQHRFGVRQRALLEEKAADPDVLILSATPIPRTLSLTLYGDLDVSIIDELPPGRTPVITRYVPYCRRESMYRYIETQIKSSGIQAYVVCPVIDNNGQGVANSAESVFEQLKSTMDVRIAVMHGRLKKDEANRIMQDFRAAKIDLIIATTVIEVGVDVPNACIMVIESSDRFGLAQLHQLRGRVGRGSRQSYCFLLSAANSVTVRERLNILVKTNDGFEIAQKDLEMRGPGDYIGMHQHGITQLNAAMLSIEADTLYSARNFAQELIKNPNAYTQEPIKSIMKHYGSIMDGVAIN